VRSWAGLAVFRKAPELACHRTEARANDAPVGAQKGEPKLIAAIKERLLGLRANNRASREFANQALAKLGQTRRIASEVAGF
jgi:hypothetical protein